MQTRQELVLDFMKQMAGTAQTIDMAQTANYAGQKAYVQNLYLLAAVFADKYLENV